MKKKERPSWVQELMDEEIKFWKEEYPKFSIQEKAKYWSGGLYRSMRSQEESGQNPYAIFSEKWLQETLKQEPKFIELLPHIFNVWGGMFDANRVERIIKKHLKNIKKLNNN